MRWWRRYRPEAVLLGTVLVAGIVVALHVLRPDVNPWIQPLSAYGSGHHRGWFISALIVWAAMGMLVSMHLPHDVHPVARVMWWTFAGGLITAAAFPMDVPFPPAEWTLGALSVTGIIHVTGASLATAAFPIAALISARLAGRRSLRVIAAVSGAAALSVFVTPFVDVRFFGIAQRVLAAAILGWLCWHALEEIIAGRCRNEETTAR